MAEELSLVINSPVEGEMVREIAWNKDEFMAVIASVTEQYEGLVYTEGQMQSAKEDRAKLNAMKKAISDRRIEVKKKFTAPLDKFEQEVKEVVALIEKPVQMIDQQIKEYEEETKRKKKEELEEYFNEIPGDDLKELTFEKIFDSKWLNTNVSVKKAKEEISGKVTRFITDLHSIETLCEEKYQPQLKDYFIRTLDISATMSECGRLREIDRREAERKAREEERKEAEEAKRLAEEKAKAEMTPIERGCITGFNPNGNCVCCGNGGKVQCCAGCNESCNGRCGWIPVPVTEKEPEERVEVAHDPFVAAEEKQYKASFTVYGKHSQIMALKQYMKENNIKFGKVEK